MATHSSVLAWRIPGTAEPVGLPSMGSHRVRHDWSDSAAAAAAWQSMLWEILFPKSSSHRPVTPSHPINPVSESGQCPAWVVYKPPDFKSVPLEPHGLKMNEGVFLKKKMRLLPKEEGISLGRQKQQIFSKDSIKAWVFGWMDKWLDACVNECKNAMPEARVSIMRNKKKAFYYMLTVRAVQASNSFGSLRQKRHQEFWGKWLGEDYWKIQRMRTRGGVSLMEAIAVLIGHLPQTVRFWLLLSLAHLLFVVQ